MQDDAQVLADLEAVGFTVTTDDVWTFRPNPPLTWDNAVPVLVRHLKVPDHSDSTIAAIATLLSRKESIPYWADIVEAYRGATSRWPKEALAGTLARTARKEHLRALEDLFDENCRDGSVVMFVRPLLRLNKQKYASFFRSRLHNPVYGVEADAALRGKRLNED